MNVTALVGHSGDQWQVVERHAYAAYGKCEVRLPDFSLAEDNLSAYAWISRYTCREFDPETGLYYYRARYYDADLGRFTERDPIGYEGGINVYEYVKNCPISYSDPRGNYKLLPNGGIMITFGALMGVNDYIDDEMQKAFKKHTDPPGVDFLSSSKADFIEKLTAEYADCMKKNNNQKERCCIGRLRRFGHSQAGFGGKQSFSANELDLMLPPSKSAFSALASMFCRGAVINNYGCLCFVTNSKIVGIANTDLALLLAQSGGTYKGFTGLPAFGWEEQVSDPKFREEQNEAAKRNGMRPPDWAMISVDIKPGMTLKEIQTAFSFGSPSQRIRRDVLGDHPDWSRDPFFDPIRFDPLNEQPRSPTPP